MISGRYLVQWQLEVKAVAFPPSTTVTFSCMGCTWGFYSNTCLPEAGALAESSVKGWQEESARMGSPQRCKDAIIKFTHNLIHQPLPPAALLGFKLMNTCNFHCVRILTQNEGANTSLLFSHCSFYLLHFFSV